MVLLVVGVPVCSRSLWECWHYYQASQLREQAHRLEHQHRRAEALAAYRRCLELYPYFLDVHQEMAEIYMEEKDWSHALACLDKAVNACPKEPSGLALVYRQRGHCALRAGRMAEAARDLKMALSFDPNEELTRRLLERAVTSSGDSQRPDPRPAKVENPHLPEK